MLSIEKVSVRVTASTDFSATVSRGAKNRILGDLWDCLPSMKKAYKYGSRRRYHYISKESWDAMQLSLENAQDTIEAYGGWS